MGLGLFGSFFDAICVLDGFHRAIPLTEFPSPPTGWFRPQERLSFRYDELSADHVRKKWILRLFKKTSKKTPNPRDRFFRVGAMPSSSP